MQGNLPGRASADYSWAFLLHQPLHAHRISAFPTIRFIWTIAIQPARMRSKNYPLARKMPLSILYYLLVVRPAVKVLAPLSSSQLFRALITAQVKSVKPISSRLLRSLRERWRITPKTTIEIRSCHHHSPASVTSYTLHLRIVRAQKLQTRYFTLCWSSLDEPLGGCSKSSSSSSVVREEIPESVDLTIC